jgi:hypothetical protein
MLTPSWVRRPPKPERCQLLAPWWQRPSGAERLAALEGERTRHGSLGSRPPWWQWPTPPERLAALLEKLDTEHTAPWLPYSPIPRTRSAEL